MAWQFKAILLAELSYKVVLLTVVRYRQLFVSANLLQNIILAVPFFINKYCNNYYI